ncbi:MAG: hypothetical protein ACTHJX_11050 [Terriglobales bacterium]
MLGPGDTAPPQTAPDQDGRLASWAELSGERGLVLLFHRGYW